MLYWATLLLNVTTLHFGLRRGNFVSNLLRGIRGLAMFLPQEKLPRRHQILGGSPWAPCLAGILPP